MEGKDEKTSAISKEAAEALIPRFKLDKILNQGL